MYPRASAGPSAGTSERTARGVSNASYRLATQELEAAEAVRDPEILVGRDVPEVPDERAHDRRVHALQLLVRAAGDERERPRAYVGQIEQQLLVG
jgi:hypothetical protein